VFWLGGEEARQLRGGFVNWVLEKEQLLLGRGAIVLLSHQGKDFLQQEKKKDVGGNKGIKGGAIDILKRGGRS